MTLQKQLLAQLAISVAEGKRNPMDAIDVAHRDMVNGHGEDGLMVGADDPRGPFQTEQFYDFVFGLHLIF